MLRGRSERAPRHRASRDREQRRAGADYAAAGDEAAVIAAGTGRRDGPAAQAVACAAERPGEASAEGVTERVFVSGRCVGRNCCVTYVYDLILSSIEG